MNSVLLHILVPNKRNIHRYIPASINGRANDTTDILNSQCLISLRHLGWLSRCHTCWRNKKRKLIQLDGLSSLMRILCLSLFIPLQFILLQWPQHDLYHCWMSVCAVIPSQEIWTFIFFSLKCVSLSKVTFFALNWLPSEHFPSSFKFHLSLSVMENQNFSISKKIMEFSLFSDFWSFCLKTNKQKRIIVTGMLEHF